MKLKTVALCLKLLTCLIVQRSFGNILQFWGEARTSSFIKRIYLFEKKKNAHIMLSSACPVLGKNPHGKKPPRP